MVRASGDKQPKVKTFGQELAHTCTCLLPHVGRETDYGRVARDFEAMADSHILQAVRQSAAAVAATVGANPPATEAPPPPGSEPAAAPVTEQPHNNSSTANLPPSTMTTSAAPAP